MRRRHGRCHRAGGADAGGMARRATLRLGPDARPPLRHALGPSVVGEMARSLEAQRWATLARQAENAMLAGGEAGSAACMRHAAALLEAAELADARRALTALVHLADAVDALPRRRQAA